MEHPHKNEDRKPPRRGRWVLLGVLLVAGYLLWAEHSTPLMGALPYLLLLLCPLMHLFMHRGHGRHRSAERDMHAPDEREADRHPGQPDAGKH